MAVKITDLESGRSVELAATFDQILMDIVYSVAQRTSVTSSNEDEDDEDEDENDEQTSEEKQLAFEKEVFEDYLRECKKRDLPMDLLVTDFDVWCDSYRILCKNKDKQVSGEEIAENLQNLFHRTPREILVLNCLMNAIMSAELDKD